MSTPPSPIRSAIHSERRVVPDGRGWTTCRGIPGNPDSQDEAPATKAGSPYRHQHRRIPYCDGATTGEVDDVLGNQIWQSNEFYGVDGISRGGFGRQLRSTAADGQDGLDEPDGPPEPEARVSVPNVGL